MKRKSILAEIWKLEKNQIEILELKNVVSKIKNSLVELGSMNLKMGQGLGV